MKVTKDKFFKYYCQPLLILSVIAPAAFCLHDYYCGWNVYLLASSPVLFLMSFIPWVVVDEFNLLEWE